MNSSESVRRQVFSDAPCINWEPLILPDGKVIKRPCGSVTDPANWKSYDVAAATGLPVGVVLNGSGLFCVDIDNCREGNGWSKLALDTLELFPGAFVETSVSGNGLHIFGRCDPSYDWSRHRNKFGSFEFYTRDRFIAFGGNHTGGALTDHTAALAAWVPMRPACEPVAAPFAGVDVASDDEVIERLSRQRSIPGMFGDRATPAQLWAAEPAVLARFYPPRGAGQDFDHSSADSALVNALAYWTGGNPGQMDRLFRRSGLMRPKWDRPDYQASTMRLALAGRTDFADWNKLAPVPTGHASGAGGAGRATILSPVDQRSYFEGCVYVASEHAVWSSRHKRLLRPDAFRVMYGGHEFAMDGDNRKFSRNAFECLTESRAVTFPKALTTTFRPDRPTGEIIGEAVNVWPGWSIEPDPSASCERILYHIRDVVAREHSEWLIDWLAHIVQRPTNITGTAVVVRGGEGVGKDIVMEYLKPIFGTDHLITIDDAEQLFGRFNAHAERALLINVSDSTWGGDRQHAGKLRSMVTGSHRPVEKKGIDMRQAPNLSRYYFSTNEDWAVPAAQDSRRFYVSDASPHRVGDHAYFAAILAERDNGGAAALLAFLLNRTITHDLRRAPATGALVEQRRMTLRGADRWIAECIDAGEILGGAGWPTMPAWPTMPMATSTVRETCAAWLRADRHRGDIPTNNALHKALEPFLAEKGKLYRFGSGAPARGVILRPHHECRIIIERRLGGVPGAPHLSVVQG